LFPLLRLCWQLLMNTAGRFDRYVTFATNDSPRLLKSHISNSNILWLELTKRSRPFVAWAKFVVMLHNTPWLFCWQKVAEMLCKGAGVYYIR
jgi:hypothetical protein